MSLPNDVVQQLVLLVVRTAEEEQQNNSAGKHTKHRRASSLDDDDKKEQVLFRCCSRFKQASKQGTGRIDRIATYQYLLVICTCTLYLLSLYLSNYLSYLNLKLLVTEVASTCTIISSEQHKLTLN